MKLNQSDLAKIVANATFLSEHLSNGKLKLDGAQANQDGYRRLEQWRKVVAQGNQQKFQKWLKWNGWDERELLIALSTPPLSDSHSLPTWAETAIAIVEAATPKNDREQNSSKNCTDPENPVPFEELLLPGMGVARQKLLARLGSPSLSPENLPLQLLSETAYLSLERSLLQRLFNLTAKTLQSEFSHSLPLGKTLLNSIINKTKSTGSKGRYAAFVQKILSDGMVEFLQKYPVLARAIATVIDLWAQSSGEFLARLKADSSEIQRAFSPHRNLGKVVEIKSSLSDFHHQGRSVIALTFESGLKLIYKPKNLGIEVAFNQFLDWCNGKFAEERARGMENDTAFKILKVLNRDSYGWVEYVEHLPCQDEAEARQFYLGAGKLLCLSYILGASDCHNENLVACGGRLVLVDVETVMHHEAKVMEDWPDLTAASAANSQLFDSVLRTGLLPTWEFTDNDTVAYDFSGLGSAEIQTAAIRMPTWKFVNTDDMQLGYEMIYRPLEANVPILYGEPLSPNNYLEELVAGFEQMYRFLMRQREVLSGAGSPLAVLNSQQVRFIFRRTKIYDRVLRDSMVPEFLANGLDWSIQLNFLGRAFLIPEGKPQAWPILSAELKAVEQLDIPYFSAATDSDALILGRGQEIAGYFQGPSYDEVLNRLQKMDESNLARQVGIVQLAFYAKVARPQPKDPGSAASKQSGGYSPSPLTSEELVRQAGDLAREILQRAIRGADGSYSWISLIYVPTAERFQLQTVGDNFYDGNGGIALFLAAIARVTGSAEFRDGALRAIQSLRRLVQTADVPSAEKFASDLGIGGGTGLGSLIYCLVKISQFLELPELRQEAKLVATLIAPEAIASDRKWDIVGGAAGAILALLALYGATGEPWVLERAIACGRHLLEYCHGAYSSQTSDSLEHKPLIGFSHGAAGIAYSLLRLYEVTREDEYLQAARAAIAYENTLLVPEAGNWQEVTPNPTAAPVFWSTWCHGAPGIGLGRLGGLPAYGTEEILSNIEVALQTAERQGLGEIDHLCCGNLGRCEVLLVGAQKLSRPEWQEAARQLAAMAVRRAQQRGKYELFGDLPDSAFSPCFFQGVSGIGYELLRLADPESVPSVLLWE